MRTQLLSSDVKMHALGQEAINLIMPESLHEGVLQFAEPSDTLLTHTVSDPIVSFRRLSRLCNSVHPGERVSEIQ